MWFTNIPPPNPHEIGFSEHVSFFLLGLCQVFVSKKIQNFHVNESLKEYFEPLCYILVASLNPPILLPFLSPSLFQVK